MTAMAPIHPFRRSEIIAAFGIAAFVLCAIGTLLATAKYTPAPKPPEPASIKISMAPPPQDLPLLKLGGKRPNTVLPDLKAKPKIKKRKQVVKPPSVEKRPPKEPPPPEAPKIVEEPAPDPPPKETESDPEAEPTLVVDERPDAEPDDKTAPATGEGSEDGSAEGTETDPLKARAANEYDRAITRWFNRKFTVPKGLIPCAELEVLSARAVVTIGTDRVVQSYSLATPSGDDRFDGRVRAALDNSIGQKIPSPPPNYPELMHSQRTLRLTKKGQPCAD